MANSRSIGDQLKKTMAEDGAYSFYKYFEPWDVGERSQRVMELAEKDGINLYHEDYIVTGNVGKHPFQTGYLMSTKPIRVNLGPTQGGKSVTAMIEIGCMCSGEFPISLQHNKGTDTGIARLINAMNIRRWGRFDKETRRFMDYDVKADRDGTWDCGTIIGAGKYPKEKVIPKLITEETAEKIIWIGTTRRALEESWWPKMTQGQMLPEKFIDRTKGNNGTIRSDGNHIIHLVNDIRLSIITYESGFDKFEAVNVWACFFDEEAGDRQAVTAAIGHCKYFASQMTPYKGMTYTKELFVKYDPDIDLFHSVAYDSPYLPEEKITTMRSMYPDHEIAARIWGEHTSESKLPYYDAKKLRSWTRKMDGAETGFLARFMPSEDFHGVKRVKGGTLPGLMDIDSKLTVVDGDLAKNGSGHNIAWRIHEDLRHDGAYFITSDAANGADLPEDAGDYQSAIVFRRIEGADPVMVAEIETTLTPGLYAIPIIGLALIYYNNALLCAESSARGAANGMFYSEMREYPYWFVAEVQKAHTNRYLTKKGFDTNAGTRKSIFDEIENIFNQYTKDELPPIPSKTIFRMASECIRVVKNGTIRPDHPRNRPNDMLVCYGIGLWINKIFPEQIRCRTKKKKTLAKAPRDSVIGLLTAKMAAEYRADPHFPSNIGARR